MPGFQERKIGNEEVTFDWHPENKITLDESYQYKGEYTWDDNIKDDCESGSIDYLYVAENSTSVCTNTDCFGKGT